MNLKGIKNQRDNPPGIMLGPESQMFLFFSFIFFIYLAASGLHYGMRDLCCGTRCSMRASL